MRILVLLKQTYEIVTRQMTKTVSTLSTSIITFIHFLWDWDYEGKQLSNPYYISIADMGITTEQFPNLFGRECITVLCFS